METPKRKKQTIENFIKDVRRKTRRVFSSEQKIQITFGAASRCYGSYESRTFSIRNLQKIFNCRRTVLQME